MKTLNVDLGDRSYPIFIGAGILKDKDLIQPYIKGKTTSVVTNTTVAPLYLDLLHQSITDYKNIDVVHMSGYAAATYQRGINFIQVPTTLLSMVDSSVGGKTGINHALGKNMIGAFHQPQCVVIDTETLGTLDDRQLSAGISEIIKYGYINDLSFIEWLDENMGRLIKRDPEALAYAIQHSCEQKALIVAEDEKEVGRRALLNLGHTFGHAIETGLGYGKWLHGEAVAAGMVMAAELSKEHGWLSENDLKSMRSLLEKANLPTNPPKEISSEQFHDLMSIDKKVQDGVLNLVLMKSMGESILTSDFDKQALKKVLSQSH